MSRFAKLIACLMLVFFVQTAIPQSVDACPMCKAAAEQDDKQPKAYMYSILFMLAMPAVIFGSFGYGLYRMNQRESELSSFDDELATPGASSASSE